MIILKILCYEFYHHLKINQGKDFIVQLVSCFLGDDLALKVMSHPRRSEFVPYSQKTHISVNVFH